MNVDIARRWVAALRSGEYRQGRNQLTRLTFDGDLDCCLGVLCKIAVADGVIDPKQVEALEGEVEYAGQAAVLPRVVMDWVGLDHTQGEVRPLRSVRDVAPGDWYRLSALNDDGKDFDYIADVIEASLPLPD